MDIVPRDRAATALILDGPQSPTSALLCKLMANVNRYRLATDRVYFGLVSEIAELLSDDEAAILALHLAPPLAVGACYRAPRPAPPAKRRRTRVGTYA